jgi:hypothetical protein
MKLRRPKRVKEGAAPARFQMPAEAIEKAAVDARYEQRVVAFIDILGWRSKVAAAAVDPQVMTLIHRIAKIFAEIGKGIRQVDEIGAKYSSFSDHMVLTAPVDENLLVLTLRIGMTQVAAARLGFFIRGAITIGDMMHDNDVVFGPGLVDAYDLERNVAKFPRIIVHDNILPHLNPRPNYIVTEGGVNFIDPFNAAFIQIVQEFAAQMSAIGCPIGDPRFINANPFLYLKKILDVGKAELLKARDDNVWDKIAWVYDRLSGDLGLGLRAELISKRPVRYDTVGVL